MMNPKDALIKDGTIAVKAGRGRLSAEAIERCKWLVANKGWKIKGYSLEASAPVATDSVTPAAPVVNKVAPDANPIIAEIFYSFPEAEYKAVNGAGKAVGMREVCNNCRVSLVQCTCGNPVILGDMRVTIKRR